MNEYYNEEMAWRRLQDLQREIENHRTVDGGGAARVMWWLPMLARRVWWVGGASRRAPRWGSTGVASSPSRRIAS